MSEYDIEHNFHWLVIFNYLPRIFKNVRMVTASKDDGSSYGISILTAQHSIKVFYYN
mgnify:CR=1 FL=1